MNKYVCSICGETFSDMNEYSKHVVDCVKNANNKIEEEKKAQYLEKVNAAINKVKKAEDYYKEQLEKFKSEFLDEYEVNFGKKKECKCNKQIVNKQFTREDYPELFELLDFFGLN